MDDQALVRAGFRMVLATQRDIEVVGEAADGHEAVRLAQQMMPDVVLMDIRMPALDGLAATRVIAAMNSAWPVRVVILTTYDLDEYVFDALAAGASGFLLKDVRPEDSHPRRPGGGRRGGPARPQRHPPAHSRVRGPPPAGSARGGQRLLSHPARA